MLYKDTQIVREKGRMISNKEVYRAERMGWKLSVLIRLLHDF